MPTAPPAPETPVRDLIEERLDALLKGIPKEDAARAREIALRAYANRLKEPAAWALAIQPKNPPTDGTNGMHRIVGIMQTPETDEELTALLEELS